MLKEIWSRSRTEASRRRYPELMASDPRVIIQVAQGSRVERQLRSEPPEVVARGTAVIDVGPADEAGGLESPGVGEVVLSVPSPETLAREPDEVRRVVALAGPGSEPLVVVVEAAELLRDDELAVVLDAAQKSSRPVIIRIIRDA
jgi:hypothetical protein